MKLTKILLSTLSVATLAFTFSACDTSKYVTVNNGTTNNANKPNTAVVINSNQTTVSNTAPVSNTSTSSNSGKTSTAPTPAGKSDAEKIQGELQTGKTESVILYVGMETGDYAAYCFANDSEAGRAILNDCKDKEQCEVTGTTGEGTCKVPGLEADLSASAKILKVESVKSLGRKK
jgi:hypothetical protein